MSGRLAKAAKMFGCLRSSIFVNGSLSIAIKRCVYTAIVVSTCYMGQKLGLSRLPRREDCSPSITVASGVFLGCLIACSGGIISLLNSWLWSLA